MCAECIGRSVFCESETAFYVCLGKAKDYCSCLLPLTPLHIFSRNNESRHHPLRRDWFVISSLLINGSPCLKSALKRLSENCSDLQSRFPPQAEHIHSLNSFTPLLSVRSVIYHVRSYVLKIADWHWHCICGVLLTYDNQTPCL